MLGTEIVSDIKNNFCTQHVLPMFCKKGASDRDLPVQNTNRAKKSDQNRNTYM